MPPVVLPAGDLRQPDGRSCGAACLVVDAMLADPAYAAAVAARVGGFADEVLTEHRGLTGVRDLAGRAQLPWPRALGTPPWAVAARLARHGGRRRIRLARWGRARRGRVFDRLHAAAAAGERVPVYVGDRRLPRHVVLALGVDDAAVVVYDPATGRTRALRRDSAIAAELGVGSWGTPWFVVLPTDC